MAKKVISLFSGAGGFDIGIEKAGFKTAVLVEMDSSCCDTLRCNFPSTPVLEGDICKIPTNRMLKAAGLKRLEAALVIGGPPCQSFSLAGKRLGMDDERGMLVLEFIRVVRECLPVGFIMENVKGMMNWDGGRAMDAIMDELKDPVLFKGKEYRYNVSFRVLNAADYGAPQFRERVILVGNRVGKKFEFPKPTHGLKNINLVNGNKIKPYRSVEDAIGSLPDADEPSETAKRISKTIKERIVNHGY
jgi:DNA (cytosine-5)-methyltransferase 1